MRGRNIAFGILGFGLGVGGAWAARWKPRPFGELYERNLPLVFGHRGASASAPENTLPAFQAALDQGADGVELDVQLTADGVPVVIHDDTVDRTTDGRGPVAARTLEELKRLDAGARFGAAFAGTRVPTLGEVFELARGRLLVNVELKTDDVRDHGLEQRVVETIGHHGMRDQVVLSSFNPVSLWRLRRLEPSLPRGMLYAPDQPRYLRERWLAPLVRPDAMHPGRTLATRAHVESLRADGFRVNVWTVDERSEVSRLVDLGVDGIITNRPSDVVKWRDEIAAAR